MQFFVDEARFTELSDKLSTFDFSFPLRFLRVVQFFSSLYGAHFLHFQDFFLVFLEKSCKNTPLIKYRLNAWFRRTNHKKSTIRTSLNPGKGNILSTSQVDTT